MKKELRPYQIEAIETVNKKLKEGVNKQLLVLATGMGKTTTSASIVNQYKKALWVTHTEELILQSATALMEFNPNVGIIKAERFDIDSEIVVASIQTLWRRLDRIDPNLFDIIVIDEAHFSASVTWSKAINHFNPTLLLGLTATPHRADGMPLGNIFDEIVFERDILWGIQNGYLCELKAIRVKTDVSLDNVRTTAGELNSKDLALVNNPERNKLIVDKYREYCNGLPCLVFCIDVEHAIELSRCFSREGYNSTFVVGDEKLCPDRKQRIDAFKTNEVQVVTNVSVLCLDDKTEILTENGWTSINEMTYDHKVANWDNGTIWFDNPKFIIKRERFENEKMVVLNSKFKDIRVTDRHNMVYRKRNGSWVKNEAKDILNKSLELPISGQYNPSKIELSLPFIYNIKDYNRAISANSYAIRKNNKNIDKNQSIKLAKERLDSKINLKYKNPDQLSLAECKFIGFWLGDGSKSKTKDGCLRYNLSQSLVYTEIIKWIDNVLNQCNIQYIKRDKSHTATSHYAYELNRGTGFGNQKRNGVFNIEPYLDKNGSKYLQYFTEKQFDAFLEGLWFADGNHKNQSSMPKNGCVIYSSNYSMLSLLQAIACCRGYRTTLYKSAKPKKNNHKQLWIFSFKKAESFIVAKEKFKFEEIPYLSERVWCVTSHSGNIITRRNGHVTITGNTAGFDYPDIQCIIMARPTKSLTVYLQAIGRGTRLKSNGAGCMILDIVDISKKHKLVNTWSLDENKPIDEKVFITKEEKEKLLNEEKIARETKIANTVKKDEVIQLFKIPKVTINTTSYRMREPATEAQLKWIANLGYDIVNITYTKAMCNAIISALPATDNQVKALEKMGYDTSQPINNAEAQACFNEHNKRSVEKIKGSIFNEL